MMKDDFEIERLGPATVDSPLDLGTDPGDDIVDFTPEDARIVADIEWSKLAARLSANEAPPLLELAGPRQKIFFEAGEPRVGIVTCGGICPGLNTVIRGLVMTLWHAYGVRGITGFRYGFAGLVPREGHPIVELTPAHVRDIHTMGGTVLGTSRGPQDPGEMVDTLERMKIGLLFAIGGDGTFRGALKIHDEVLKRGAKIGVIGIPKTIDNDIPLVDQTFGFDTAVGLAAEAISAAYAEAQSTVNGIGLVKLMGRASGFIAANAALAMRNVNLVLIPELAFDLEGEHGLYAYLEDRFAQRKFTVIVAAEGAGQNHLEAEKRTDASGNAVLGDIGVFLKDRILERFAGSVKLSLKYIDPSYMIRSAPPCSTDSIFCGYLAQAAAHAGMSGRTGMAVGRSHGRFTHIPLVRLAGGRKNVDPEGDMWRSVLESTGQPIYLRNTPPKHLARLSFVPHV
jgi:6-phosphofructokinase 1